MFVGLPSLDGASWNAPALMGLPKDAVVCEQMGCFIAANRNDLWCRALNMRPRPDRFLFLDTDVIPDPGYVETLEAEMAALKCDIIGGVYAMKNDSGDTSVALDTGLYAKKMKVAEVNAAPASWTNNRLLVATGLMLIDFTKPWVEKVYFSTRDLIEKRGEKFVTVNDSEDYRFCSDARAHGAVIGVTRKIGTIHVGRRDHQFKGGDR